MKLFKFQKPTGPAMGLLTDDGAVDVSAALEKDCPGFAEATSSEAQKTLASCASADPRLDPSSLEYLPFLGSASRVFCVGLNYASHALEVNKDPGRYPTIFTRFLTSIVGHRQNLVRPKVSKDFDFEGEVTIVIGTGGRHITEAAALNHIGGITCFNDGSLRDFQSHAAQYTPGKNFDNTASLGPWVTTADEYDLSLPIDVETRLNGDVVQKGDTGDLVFGMANIIAYISSFTHLNPGDIIATGTPSGTGGGRSPKLFMKPDDRIEVTVGGVGILSNLIVDEDA